MKILRAAHFSNIRYFLKGHWLPLQAGLLQAGLGAWILCTAPLGRHRLGCQRVSNQVTLICALLGAAAHAPYRLSRGEPLCPEPLRLEAVAETIKSSHDLFAQRTSCSCCSSLTRSSCSCKLQTVVSVGFSVYLFFLGNMLN